MPSIHGLLVHLSPQQMIIKHSFNTNIHFIKCQPLHALCFASINLGLEKDARHELKQLIGLFLCASGAAP